MEFKIEGLDAPIVLPDEYLTVEQVERGYRSLVTNGVATMDIEDPAAGRLLLQAILGDDTPDLGKVSAGPGVMETLLKVYGHVGELFAKSMVVGDEINEGVEAKKESTPEKPKAKKRNKQRSQSK